MINFSRPLNINLVKHSAFIALLAIVVVSQFGQLQLVQTIVTKIESTTTTTKSSKMSPQMRAFLDAIAWAEVGMTGDEGYRALVFNGKFSNFSRHPNIKQCAPIKGTPICSTAAGRYQFLDRTWSGLQSKLGLRDFSPTSQDIAAVELIRQKNAIALVESGNFDVALCKVGGIWASIPCGNAYNQSHKSLGQFKQVYQQQLALYQK